MCEETEQAESRGDEIAYVALGANLGDRLRTFAQAIEALHAEPSIEIEAASRVYETPPFGPPGQPPYLNAVLRLRFGLSPEQLLDRLQAIEERLGRDRTAAAVRWGPRTVDLDILLIGREGQRQIEQPRLEVPHPRLQERAFVLAPLADLAPDLVPPPGAERVAALLAKQADRDEVELTPAPSNWPLG